MQLMSYNLTAFGSRFNCTFDPSAEVVYHGSLGRTFDAPLDLLMAVKTEGNEPDTFRYLPYARKDSIGFVEAEHFELTDMQTTMTSVTFTGKSVAARAQLKVTFTSPFYPGSVMISTAPFFYVDIEVSRLDRLMWLQGPQNYSGRGKVIFKLRRKDSIALSEGDRMALDYATPVRYHQMQTGEPVSGGNDTSETIRRACKDIIRPVYGDVLFNTDDLQFELPYDFSGDEQVKRCSLVWASFCGDPVLHTLAGMRKLKYTDFFNNAEMVTDYAIEHMDDIRRRTELFDSAVSDASYSLNQKNLLAQSFQSYALNSIWCEPKGDEHDWFSVWEGDCFYDSTVDVEYNDGLFYFAFWPDLLSWTLDEWASFEQKNETGSYIPHDIGSAYTAMGQLYHHPMEVEENCNFLLMLYAHARTAADGRETAQKHEGLARRLVEYLVDADTTGDGIPNTGTANTIDDATPAVQYAKKNTYLAVKTLCALRSAARLADLYWDDSGFGKICEDRATLIAATLEKEAWLGDHYAVCIDNTEEFTYRDSWSGSEVKFPSERIPGWDAYSLYFANGLLYWALAGEKIADLGLDHMRLRMDIRSALAHSLTEYGCTHSSQDRTNVWVSQNLWRDCIALALDAEFEHRDAPAVDVKDMADRYWSMQVLFNTRGFSKSFIDTYYGNDLSIYPRGLTSAGWLLFMPALAKPGERFVDLAKTDWAGEKLAWVEAE